MNLTRAFAVLLLYIKIMEPAEVIDICRDGIYALIVMSAPCMLVSLAVGLIIALFQALTQIQESTLTFVPKMLAMLITLSISMGFMLRTLIDFSIKLQDKIVHIQ